MSRRILTYARGAKRDRQVWLLAGAVSAIAVIGLLTSQDLSRWLPIGGTPNQGDRYLDRSGAFEAVTELRQAISVYRELNGGTLPPTLEAIRPLLRPNAARRIAAADLLKFAHIFPADDSTKSLTESRGASFIVAVFVIKAGRWTINQTLIATEGVNGTALNCDGYDCDISESSRYSAPSMESLIQVTSRIKTIS